MIAISQHVAFICDGIIASIYKFVNKLKCVL